MMNCPSEVFVISDLHLGGRYGSGDVPRTNPDCAASFPDEVAELAKGTRKRQDRGFRINTHADELSAFLDEVAERAKSTGKCFELVINGDFVDFLAEEGPNPKRPWRPFIDDQGEAIETLNAIAGRDSVVFESLTALLRAGVSVTLLLGNHDVELSLPDVRYQLGCLLKVKPTSPFRFIYDGEAYLIGRDVLLEHGNRYDGWNVIDYERLRRFRAEASRGLEISGDAMFHPPPGSRMVETLMNPIKEQYAFIDLLKPENEAAIPLLLALEPAYMLEIEEASGLHEEAEGYGPKAPARPARPGHIAKQGELGDRLQELLPKIDPGHWERLQALVSEATLQQKKANRQIASGALARALSFARLVTARSWEERLPLLLDGFRELQSDKSFDRSVETEEHYLDAAMELATNGVRVVLFGHTHLAKDIQLGGGRRYLNTGAWADCLRVPKSVINGPREHALAALNTFAAAVCMNRFDDYIEFAPTFGHILMGDDGQCISATLHDYKAGQVQQL